MGPTLANVSKAFIKEATMKHYVLLVGHGFIIPFDGFEGGKYVHFGVLWD